MKKLAIAASLTAVMFAGLLGGSALAAPSGGSPLDAWQVTLARIGDFTNKAWDNIADALVGISGQVDDVKSGVDDVAKGVEDVSAQLDDEESGLGAIKDGVGALSANATTLIEFADAADVMLDWFAEPIARIALNETGKGSVVVDDYDSADLYEYSQVRHVSLTLDYNGYLTNLSEYPEYTGGAYFGVEAKIGDNAAYTLIYPIGDEILKGYCTLEFNTDNWRVGGVNGTDYPFTIHYTYTSTWVEPLQ